MKNFALDYFNQIKTTGMKKLFCLLILAFTISASMAQKVIKDANASVRKVDGYHAISVSGGIDLYLSQGEESVAVSASETKYRDRIMTEVKDGVLQIWYEHKTGFRIETGNHRLKAYVSFKNLDKLKASGGSDIYVDGAIKVSELNLGISGGSDFKGRVEAGEMKVEATGGSDVHISGIVEKLSIDASGGSDFKGYELAVDLCNLEASGGSDIYITVNKELSAVASGGSDVYYKGNGVIRQLKSSGSSSIKKTDS